MLVMNRGEANIELVGQNQNQQQQKQHQQEDEEEESWEVQRYSAELSEDDLFIIPATYPVAINATSNLNFFAFGINAENNQRYFLAGIYLYSCFVFMGDGVVYLQLVMCD